MNKIKDYRWRLISFLYRYFQKKWFGNVNRIYPSFKYHNPIEVVYSSLLEVYGKHLNGIFSLQIMGIEVQPVNELGEININITLKRPGFLIGKCGENINRLKEVLFKKFNDRKVHVKAIESK